MACVEGTTPTAKWSRARSRARPRSWVSEPFPRPRGLNVPSAWQGNVGRTPPWDSVWVPDCSGDDLGGWGQGGPKSGQLKPGPVGLGDKESRGPGHGVQAEHARIQVCMVGLRCLFEGPKEPFPCPLRLRGQLWAPQLAASRTSLQCRLLLLWVGGQGP